MTIAIAIKARNGIVVAADTEESTGGYFKGVKGKMAAFFSHADGWSESCIVAGAGNGGYCDALIEELGRTYRTSISVTNVYDTETSSLSLQGRFRECIKRFYEEHILPFSAYPETQQPGVEMLIACQRKTIMGVFRTEKTIVNDASLCTAIGYGAPFAEFLLGKLWTNMSVEQAEVLAAYVIFMVKDAVPSCGHFTTMSTIRGPQIEQTESGSVMIPSAIAQLIHREQIEKWEHSFRKRWWKAERELVFSMIDQEVEAATRKLG